METIYTCPNCNNECDYSMVQNIFWRYKNLHPEVAKIGLDFLIIQITCKNCESKVEINCPVKNEEIKASISKT